MSIDTRDIILEIRLRNDWEFLLEYLEVSCDMTVREFVKALNTINHYGWEITCNELLEVIKN